MVAAKAAAMVDVKQAVLEVLNEREYGPTELINRLESRFSDAAIKDAVSELLDEMKIELLSNRKLRLRSPERAKAS